MCPLGRRVFNEENENYMFIDLNREKKKKKKFNIKYGRTYADGKRPIIKK